MRKDPYGVVRRLLTIRSNLYNMIHYKIEAGAIAR